MARSKTNSSLNDAKRAKKDEFYTQLSDIENELRHYKEHFKDKVVFCNCDDPYESNFFKYFALNFNHLGLKKLIATCYSGSPITGTQLSLFGDEPEDRRTPYKAVVTTVHDTTGEGSVDMFDVAELFRNGENKIEKLKGNGDFRSPECVDLLKEADIVVTNPPFSLFREFVTCLIEHNKKFLIIGNINSVKYEEVFPLIASNKLWCGVNAGGGTRKGNSLCFAVPDDYESKSVIEYQGKRVQQVSAWWLTNLDHKQRHELLPLYKRYSREEFPKYVNFDAIEVSKTSDIPVDYPGLMGVPISFLPKYNPDQFELVGVSRDLVRTISDDIKKKGDYPQIGVFYLDRHDGTYKKMYDRIVIRHKHPEI